MPNFCAILNQCVFDHDQNSITNVNVLSFIRPTIGQAFGGKNDVPANSGILVDDGFFDPSAVPNSYRN